MQFFQEWNQKRQIKTEQMGYELKSGKQ